MSVTEAAMRWPSEACHSLLWFQSTRRNFITIKARCIRNLKPICESRNFKTLPDHDHISAAMGHNRRGASANASRYSQYSATSKTVGRPGHFPESDVIGRVRYTN